MRRNNMRSFNEEYETKKIVYISISVLLIAILAFVVTFFIYSRKLNNETEIGSIKTTTITDLGSKNSEDLSEASSSVGKTVNEMQNEKGSNVTNESETKVAINTSNMEKTNTVKTNETTNTTTKDTQVKTETPKEEQKPKEPTFSKPVEGEMLREFAKDKLVYSATLKEWVTHNGIDIKADKATIVKASEEGTVRSIKNDPRYGITVVVEHTSGYTTVYSNLLTAEFVKENEKVKKGQTLGTVGNTASFEIADESHLHFEILKNGEYLDPSIYIK